MTSAAYVLVAKLGLDSSAILKTVQLQNQSSTPVGVNIQLLSGGVPIQLLNESVPGPGLFEWTGWIVLQELAEVRVDTDGGTLVWWMSGALLEGTLDRTQVPALRVTALPARPSEE